MQCFILCRSQAAAAALVFPGPTVGGARRMLWHTPPPLLKPGDHHPPLHLHIKENVQIYLSGKLKQGAAKSSDIPAARRGAPY